MSPQQSNIRKKEVRHTPACVNGRDTKGHRRRGAKQKGEQSSRLDGWRSQTVSKSLGKVQEAGRNRGQKPLLYLSRDSFDFSMFSNPNPNPPLAMHCLQTWTCEQVKPYKTQKYSNFLGTVCHLNLASLITKSCTSNNMHKVIDSKGRLSTHEMMCSSYALWQACKCSAHGSYFVRI